MKHIVKIIALLMAIATVWIGLLQTSTVPSSHTWLVSAHVCCVFLFKTFEGPVSWLDVGSEVVSLN